MSRHPASRPTAPDGRSDHLFHRLQRTPTVVREGLVLALLAGSAVVAFVVDPGRELSPGGLALALAPLVVLGWRHRAPVAVLLTVEVLAVAVRLEFGPNGPSDLMILVALYAVASRAGPWLAAMGVAVDLVLLGTTTALGDAVPVAQVRGELIGQAVIDVVVVLVALYVATRRQHLQALSDRADRLARTQELEAQAAVDRERRRIARELHDVVAHHVSVMTLQAGAVQRRLQALDVPAELDTAVGELRTTGHEAMQELRRLLGVLRTDPAADPHHPQPGLDDVPDLVTRVRDAGLDVSLALDGPVDVPTGGLALTAYRIVQEALTNTLRHAGAVPATVDVTVTDEQLQVEVRDHPRTPPLPRYGRGDDAPSGHGLTGMRERVELYGGTLTAAAQADGGFLVRAELPLRAPPPSEG